MTREKIQEKIQVKPSVSSGLFTSFRWKTSQGLGSCAIDCKRDAGCLSFQFLENFCYIGGMIKDSDSSLTSVFIASN